MREGVHLVLLVLFFFFVREGYSTFENKNDEVILSMMKERGTPSKACWGEDCYPDDCMGFDGKRCCNRGCDVTVINNNVNTVSCGTPSLPGYKEPCGPELTCETTISRCCTNSINGSFCCFFPRQCVDGLCR